MSTARLFRNLAAGPGTSFAFERKDRGTYVYPGLALYCGKPDLEEYKGTDTLGNPLVVVEILSPSTEAFDRGLKFQKYREIPSLREYILISQDKVLVERYVKQTNDEWLYSSMSSLDTSLALASVP